MKNAIAILAISALGVAAAAPAGAASLSGTGDLNVSINDGNGAIDSAVYAGTEFYRLGSFVSDYGFQVGTNTGSFGIARNGGSVSNISGVSVSGFGDSASVSGTYVGAGSNLAFSKTYSILGDVLRTEVTLTNVGAANSFRYFFTADPDQNGFATTNDVATTPDGSTVLTSDNGSRGVAVGSSDLLGFSGGFGLGINSGSELNSFFATGGVDPNRSLADVGFAIGFETALGNGESFSFAYDQAFGAGLGDALAKYDAVQGAAVPEPFTILGSLAAVGFGAAAKRKMAK